MKGMAQRLLATIALVVLINAPSTTCAVVVRDAAELVEAVNHANTGGDKNIVVKDGLYTLDDIHFWSDSQNTLVERNLIINCDRGIGFGLGDRGHTGGTIRNNMIFHDSSQGFADVGIGLESAVNARVYNNTIYYQNSYPNSIEYRFTKTTGLLIANNLSNRAIVSRDGASANVSNNVTNAAGSWFKDASAGDLHLISPIASVVDRGKALSGLVDDIDKTVRPQGLNYDIGADEFGEAFVGITGMADLNGNGSGEIALLRERSGESPGLVVILDTETGKTIRSISFLSTGYTPKAVAVLPDMSGNGAPELAVLGVHTTTGTVLVQVRDALSRKLVNNIYFRKASSPRSLSVIGDLNGNGVPELAAPGVNAATGKALVEVRDPLTKALVRTFP